MMNVTDLVFVEKVRGVGFVDEPNPVPLLAPVLFHRIPNDMLAEERILDHANADIP